jgi:hypothetical protein
VSLGFTSEEEGRIVVLRLWSGASVVERKGEMRGKNQRRGGDKRLTKPVGRDREKR